MMQSLNTGLTGRALKILLFIFMFGSIAGLVLTDVGGYFRDGGVSRNDIARIGHETIGLNAFGQTFQHRLQQMNIPMEQGKAMGMAYVVLNQEVNRLLLAQAAIENGLRISDAVVAADLNRQLIGTGLPGSPKEILKGLTQVQGITEKQLVTLLRGDLAIAALTDAVSSPKQAIPDTLPTTALRFLRQQRTADVIAITPASLTQKPVINDTKLAAFYAENKARYRTAEKRDLAYVIIPQKTLLPNVAINDDDAQKFYDAHKDAYMNPARVGLAQIIAKDEKTAQAIMAQKPTDLASVTQPQTDYLPQDTYTTQTLGAELTAALFPKQPTGLVGPIKTALGWHVLLVKDYTPATQKTFAEVKDAITRDLRDRAGDEKLNAVTESLDKLAASSTNLDPIAQEFNVSVQTLRDLDQDSALKTLHEKNIADAVATRLQEAAFTLAEGEISPLIDTKDGDIVLAQVTKITPSTDPALNSIKDRVKADAIQDATREAMNDLANELVRGKDAASLQLESVLMAPMDRPLAVRTLGQEAGLALFTLTPIKPVTSMATDKGVTVLHLRKIIPYTGDIDANAAKKMTKQLQGDIHQELQQQYTNGWRQRLGVTINEPLIQAYFTAKQGE